MPRGQPAESASQFELHSVKKGKDGNDYMVELISNKKAWVPYVEESDEETSEHEKPAKPEEVKVPAEEPKKTKSPGEKKPVKHRAPSQYNLFIGEKIKYIKENMPDIQNKDRMKKAQEMWHAHKELEKLSLRDETS